MKLKELFEAPLPSSWDDAIYDEKLPFSTRVKYAQERAKVLGRGSARVVFNIKYKGQPSALKVAANRKGMAQNEVEVDLLNDWYAKSLGLFIPMIDYDTKNSQPTWIHTRIAKKATDADFKRIVGVDARGLVEYAKAFHGERTMFGDINSDYFKRVKKNHPTVEAIIDYYGNYGRPQMGDYTSPRNWGIYNRRLVIIDAGFNDDIYARFYS